MLAGWLKKHAKGDDDSAHSSDEGSEEAVEEEDSDDGETTDKVPAHANWDDDSVHL